MKRLVIVVGLSSTLTFDVFAVGSAGYSNSLLGARAMGQANVFVAQGDDPSTIYFNPAAMTQLPSTQLTVGSTFNLPSISREGAGIPKDEAVSHLSVVPNFYMTHRRSQDSTNPWSVGIGLYMPFGLATEWAPTSSVRYVATESNMTLLVVNPSAAYQINESLSIGGGVDYANLAKITTKNQLNIDGALGDGSPDASSNLSGHGSGWGYNVGLLYKPFEKHAFGGSYRSQIHVPIRGSLEVTGLSANAQAAGNFSDSTYTTDATSSLVLPASAILGYAFHPTPRWTLSMDYEWTQWNVFQEQNVALAETDATRLAFINGGSNVITQQRKWRNTSSIGAGFNFNQNDAWAWRGGYAFYQRTVPQETYSPDLPDAATHVLALGFSRSWGAITADVAYNGYFFAQRSIDNTVGNAVGASVDGTYKVFSSALGLNLKYKFN